ncbi:MAG: STAS domain-containing protein, partial [Sedimentisphaerales bacterium]|nr:STAS domain-containing protein [Sedimentisphaerales bacterium]
MATIQPRISVKTIANSSIITFTSEKILEETEIVALEHSILPIIEQAKIAHIVLNFEKVQFLSSAVLGFLIRLSKKIYQRNGQLRLCCINTKIFEIFKITRLDRVFEIYEDVDAAV